MLSVWFSLKHDVFCKTILWCGTLTTISLYLYPRWVPFMVESCSRIVHVFYTVRGMVNRTFYRWEFKRPGSPRPNNSSLFEWLSMVVDHNWTYLAESLELMSNWPHMHMREKAIIFYPCFSFWSRNDQYSMHCEDVYCICWLGLVLFWDVDSRPCSTLVLWYVLKRFKDWCRFKSALNESLDPRNFWVKELLSSWDVHTVNVAWLFPRRQSGEGKLPS